MTFPQILLDIALENVRAGMSQEMQALFDKYDLELVWLPFELSEKEEEMAGFGILSPGQKVLQGILPVVPLAAINWERMVFFFLLDVIPDYIQKTFGVNGDGKFPEGDARRAVRLNEDIPLKDVGVAVIVYNMSETHLNFAHTLMGQLESLVPRAQVVMLPVYG